MGDVIVGHGENGDLSNGPVAALDTASSLVESCQIGIEVTWVTSTTGYFFSRGRNFSKGIGITGIS